MVPLAAIARPARPLTGAAVATLRNSDTVYWNRVTTVFSVTVIVWTPALAFGWTKICANAVPPSLAVASGVVDQVSPDESAIDVIAVVDANGFAPKVTPRIKQF